VRFAVDQTIQAELTAYLEAQIVDFNESCDEEINFDGKYKPDPGEVLCIDAFDDLDNLAQSAVAPLNFPIADPANFSFDNIKALFVGVTEQNGSMTIYLQHFDRRRVISDAGFSIFHSQDVYKKIEGSGLTLDNKITAKLSGTKLCFFSFFHIRQMFDMSSYYAEATDADITEFAGMEQISVANLPDLILISDTWVRRKLWLIRESQILEKVSLTDMKAIAVEFQITIESEEINGQQKLRLPATKKELKTLLRFLDEDYYRSPLSKTNFISNSKRAVPGMGVLAAV
jgi:hypothetical protein